MCRNLHDLHIYPLLTHTSLLIVKKLLSNKLESQKSMARQFGNLILFLADIIGYEYYVFQINLKY